MLERDVGELDRDLLDHGPPEAARGQHVRLVDARQELAPVACELEGQARHARDLGLRVEERVERLASRGPLMGLTTLTEVDATGQLADDEHVHALDEVGPKGRRRRERGLGDDRAQVREEPERLAEREEPLLGADGRGRVVPLRSTDRPQEDRIRLAADGQVLVADRRPYASMATPPTSTSDQSIVKPKRSPAAARTRWVAVDDLGPDAVAGDGDDPVRSSRLLGSRSDLGAVRVGRVPQELLERGEIGLERGLDDVRR